MRGAPRHYNCVASITQAELPMCVLADAPTVAAFRTSGLLWAAAAALRGTGSLATLTAASRAHPRTGVAPPPLGSERWLFDCSGPLHGEDCGARALLSGRVGDDERHGVATGGGVVVRGPHERRAARRRAPVAPAPRVRGDAPVVARGARVDGAAAPRTVRREGRHRRCIRRGRRHRRRLRATSDER